MGVLLAPAEARCFIPQACRQFLAIVAKTGLVGVAVSSGA